MRDSRIVEEVPDRDHGLLENYMIKKKYREEISC